MSIMKTCATCICFRRTGASPMLRRITYDTGVKIVPAGEEGECRQAGPRADFRWPLTSAGDWCACHRAGRGERQEEYVQDTRGDGLTTGAQYQFDAGRDAGPSSGRDAPPSTATAARPASIQKSGKAGNRER